MEKLHSCLEAVMMRSVKKMSFFLLFLGFKILSVGLKNLVSEEVESFRESLSPP